MRYLREAQSFLFFFYPLGYCITKLARSPSLRFFQCIQGLSWLIPSRQQKARKDFSNGSTQCGCSFSKSSYPFPDSQWLRIIGRSSSVEIAGVSMNSSIDKDRQNCLLWFIWVHRWQRWFRLYLTVQFISTCNVDLPCHPPDAEFGERTTRIQNRTEMLLGFIKLFMILYEKPTINAHYRIIEKFMKTSKRFGNVVYGAEIIVICEMFTFSNQCHSCILFFQACTSLQFLWRASSALGSFKHAVINKTLSSPPSGFWSRAGLARRLSVPFSYGLWLDNSQIHYWG